MRLSRELTRSFFHPVTARQTLEVCWFPVALGLYLLLVVGLRSLVAKSLMFDESEQLALSQVLALGYGSQPPLVVWVVWTVGCMFGPSAASIIGVRFAILGLMYCGLYACGRALTATPARAGLAAASALLVPAVCWDFMLDKTNTPMACAMAAFTVAALVRAVRTEQIRWAVVVGVIVALGILSKYTFIPFAAGLLTASLTVSQYRGWVWSRRGLMSVAVAVVVVLPHAAWVLLNRAELAEGITQTITNRPDRPLGVLLASACDVGVGACGVTLAVFAILAPGVFRRIHDLPAATRVLGRALLFAGVAGIVVVVLAGGNRFKAHWFTPLAVLLPTFLISRMEFISVARLRVAGLWSVISVAVVSMTIIAGVVGKTDCLQQGRVLHARDELAVELAETLSERPDSIVCDSLRDAGNIRLACPGSTVLVLRTPTSSRPVLRGSVVLVWDASKDDALHRETERLLFRDYGLRPDSTARVQFVGERQSAVNPNGRRLGVMRLSRD